MAASESTFWESQAFTDFTIMSMYLQVSNSIPFSHTKKILDEVIQSGLPQSYSSREPPLVHDGCADAIARHYDVRGRSEIYPVGQPRHENRKLTELSID